MTNRTNPVSRYPQTETDTPRANLNRVDAQLNQDKMQTADILERSGNSDRNLSKSEAEALARIEQRMTATETERASIIAEYPGLIPTAQERQQGLSLALPEIAPRGIEGETSIPTASDKMTTSVLKRDHSGAFSYDDARNFSLGALVQGLANGKVDSDSVERRALSEGVDSAGGFAVPAALSAQVIDRLRPVARVIEAGARVIQMDSEVLYIPRISAGVTGTWRAEGGSVAVDAPTFDRLELKPKSLAVAVRISNELLEDITQSGAQAIERELLQALALQLDQAALNGTGVSNQPTGIVNTSGVTVNANGTNGTSASWSMISRAVKSVEVANAIPTGVLAAPRTWHTLDGLTDTTGQPLRAPAYASKVATYSTNSIPTNLTVGSGTTCSQVIAGDWSRLLIGVRPSVQVRIIRDQSHHLDTLETLVVAHLRADIGVEQPSAFAVELGVK